MFYKNSNIIKALILLPPIALAGSLDSPAPPGDPASAMYPLSEICNRLDTGAQGTKRSVIEVTSGPGPGGCTLNDVMEKAPVKDNGNGVQPGEVIAGKQYWGLTDNWGSQTGTMPNQGTVTITPTTTDQPIAGGYHSGSGVVKGEPNLSPENIRAGVTLFGITGTYTSAPCPACPACECPTCPTCQVCPTCPDSTPTPTPTPTPSSGSFRDTLADGSQGPEMVWISAGTFRMGDIQGGGYSDEQPVHSVSVNRFAMGRYEVTFAEYDKFADATGRGKPDDEGWGRGNRPVMRVSWHDATAYAAWLSTETGQQYRLPTEAEWEYAARAGTETKYWWGNEIGSNQANCSNSSCGDSFQYTAPIGSFAANPFGLYDTAGNVWEWTCSEYTDSYNGKEEYCGSGDSWQPVIRGGSWNFAAWYVRAADRGRYSLVYRYGYVGFRLARISL